MTEHEELAAVVEQLRAGYDILPYMTGFHAAGELGLRALPDDMKALLEGSPDYRSPEPGSGPVWLQIAGEDEAAELIVYRSRSSGQLYVMAPGQD
ncbi:hypothetical protein [Sphingomonas panaciterrae]|uniref:hypothetical protein n=1 Tax=Sphingomonas panaciterrae TaxID=1462999 RepID=UPI002FEEDA81